ncbi:hypothetical protein D1007_46979 [Hordeum vulgare]|nr:hypothetical protein D1007_46979 [Hordeum vulgare]
MMANLRPLVVAEPLDTRPVSVKVKLFAGFYDVRVTGRHGEQGFYRILMHPASSLRILVANLASCSIGYLSRVGTVGDARMPMTNVEVLCADPRGRLLGPVVFGEVEVRNVIERFDSVTSVTLETPRHSTSGKTPLVYSRRSTRLKAVEPAFHQTMLEKATLLKIRKLNGKARAKSKGLLPAVELLELATKNLAPLPRKDVLQLADACDIYELDLNKVAPEVNDV